jgi:hypothetical protein
MRASGVVGAVALLVALTGCGQGGAGASASSGSTASETPSTETPSTEVPSTSTDVSAEPPGGGTQAPPPAGTTPSAPVSLSPSGPVVPPGVRQVPSAQVDASALPEYYEHRGEVWVYDGGRSLQMFAAASSGCGGVEARLVDQSDSAVRIILRALPQPQGGSPDSPACTAVITPRPVTVGLDAPLAERRVFIAASR